MSDMVPQITDTSLFVQLFDQVNIKENNIVRHYWPMGGESTGDKWMVIGAESVFMPWRHNDE